MTIYEKIKNMIIEKLARFIENLTYCDIEKCEECGLGEWGEDGDCDERTIRKWLEREVEE